MRHRINIKKYPKFFEEFVSVLRQKSPKGIVSSTEAEFILKTDFKIKSAKIVEYESIGMVYIDDKDLTWFLLRWA